MIAEAFKQIDLTQLITALGVAIPAIVAAISSLINHRTLKKHDKKFDTTAAKIQDIDERVNGR